MWIVRLSRFHIGDTFNHFPSNDTNLQKSQLPRKNLRNPLNTLAL